MVSMWGGIPNYIYHVEGEERLSHSATFKNVWETVYDYWYQQHGWLFA